MKSSPRSPRWLAIAVFCACVLHGGAFAVDINEPAGKPILGPIGLPKIEVLPTQVPGAMDIPELPKIADPAVSVSLPILPEAGTPLGPDVAQPLPEEQAALPRTDGTTSSMLSLPMTPPDR